MKERIHLFDNAKFLLILLVVVGHFADEFTASHSSMRSLFLFIYSFHMPLFIFISGLFVKEMNEESKLNRKRVISYLSIGFLMKIIAVACAFVFDYQPSLSLLGEGGPAWFMFALAAYLVLAWILRGVDKKYVFICSLVLGLVVGYDPSVGDYLYISRIVVFFPFFWAGYCLTPQKVADLLTHPAVKIASLVVLLTLAFLCIAYINDIYYLRYLFTGRNSFASIGDWCGWQHRLLAYMISALCCTAVLALVPKRHLPGVTVAGSRSLQVYAWHGVVKNTLFFFGVDTLLQGLLGDYMFLAFTLLSIPVTILLSLKIFGIPLEPFMNLSFGKKKE